MRRVLLFSLALIAPATSAAGGLPLRHKRLQELANLAPPTPAPLALWEAEMTRGRATQGLPAAVVLGVSRAPQAGRSTP